MNDEKLKNLSKKDETHLDFWMIWCDAVSHKPVRRPEPIEDVDSKTGSKSAMLWELLKNSGDDVECRWSTTHDGQLQRKSHGGVQVSALFGGIRVSIGSSWSL